MVAQKKIGIKKAIKSTPKKAAILLISVNTCTFHYSVKTKNVFQIGKKRKRINEHT